MSSSDADRQSLPVNSNLPSAPPNAEAVPQSGSDNPGQELAAEPTIREADIRDAAVAACCIEARDLFSDYINDCKNVEKVEFGGVARLTVEEAEHQAKIAGCKWRGALMQLGKSAAYTPSGILAKAHVVRDYFVEYPAHDEIMNLMYSILKDLENLLQKSTD